MSNKKNHDIKLASISEVAVGNRNESKIQG